MSSKVALGWSEAGARRVRQVYYSRAISSVNSSGWAGMVDSEAHDHSMVRNDTVRRRQRDPLCQEGDLACWDRPGSQGWIHKYC